MKPAFATLCLALIVTTSALAAPPVNAPKDRVVRDWTAADGRVMKAELLEFDTKELRIKRASDLNVMKVPVTAFGADDQAFVAGLLHERALDSSLTQGSYAEKITGKFVKAVSKQGLNYQIYGDPKWDNLKRYPLVIWLHGSGQSGTDNEAQMGGATGIFTNAEHQAKNPCIMIAPQCPDSDIGWNNLVANNLMALIADLADKLPIDSKRLYLTGSSMGGFGAWNLAAKYPTVFAAVVPLCGGGDTKKADILKTVPIWAFHGDKDDMVPVERTRNAVAAIKAAGGTLCKYNELAGVGHGITGIAYPMPELHEWIFAQRLGSSASQSSQ
jgi:dipeptidyl aminopeptidase/acylaminoacyl peptidase